MDHSPVCIIYSNTISQIQTSDYIVVLTVRSYRQRDRNIFKTVTENLDACKLYNILLIKQEYKCINKNVWCSLHKSAHSEDVNASEFFLQHTFHTTKLGCQKDQFFLVFQSKTLKPNEHACMNIIYIIICLYEQGIMFHITNIMYNVYLQ